MKAPEHSPTPAAPAVAAAVAELNQKIRFSINEVRPRASLVEIVQKNAAIPKAYREVILETIAAIPESHEVLRLAANCHPHKAGFNFNFTVCAA